MAALFALLGKRWTLSVLGALLRGDDRFDQLRAAAPRFERADACRPGCPNWSAPDCWCVNWQPGRPRWCTTG